MDAYFSFHNSQRKVYVSWALPLRRIRRGIGMQNTQAGYPRIRAHEPQNFSAGITENKKRGNKHCQQTHLTPPNIHDIVESRLRISQEGAHHLGCGLFLWYPFVVSEEKGETI